MCKSSKLRDKIDCVFTAIVFAFWFHSHIQTKAHSFFAIYHLFSVECEYIYFGRDSLLLFNHLIVFPLSILCFSIIFFVIVLFGLFCSLHSNRCHFISEMACIAKKKSSFGSLFLFLCRWHKGYCNVCSSFYYSLLFVALYAGYGRRSRMNPIVLLFSTFTAWVFSVQGIFYSV